MNDFSLGSTKLRKGGHEYLTLVLTAVEKWAFIAESDIKNKFKFQIIINFQSTMDHALNQEGNWSLFLSWVGADNANELTQLVQNMLNQMQSRFQTMSENIIGRIDEMGTRIDDLERSIAELVQEA